MSQLDLSRSLGMVEVLKTHQLSAWSLLPRTVKDEPERRALHHPKHKVRFGLHCASGLYPGCDSVTQHSECCHKHGYLAGHRWIVRDLCIDLPEPGVTISRSHMLTCTHRRGLS